MKPFIRLDKISRTDDELVYSFSTSLKIFKRNTFFIRYEGGTVSHEESINAIPFAAVMSHLSWMTGADLIIPTLDSEYIQALEKAREYFHKWFSGKRKWSFKGNLVTKSIKNSPKTSKAGMLFSSGLDAITTFIRHKDEKPVLFSVFGMDILLDEANLITQCRDSFTKFAKEFGVETVFIFTDLKGLIDLPKISRYTVEWWGEVAHGMVFIGLTAPVSSHYLSKLYIASGHKAGINYGTACDLELDRHIRWASTVVDHDFHEVDRLGKIPLLRLNPAFQKYLRVCYTVYLMDGTSFNCGKCEKCLRTICGLLLNDMDPKNSNLKIDNFTLPILKKWIKKSHSFQSMFRGDEEVVKFWKHIQDASKMFNATDRYGAADFFKWFGSYEGLDSKVWRLTAKPVYAVRAARWNLLKKLHLEDKV